MILADLWSSRTFWAGCIVAGWLLGDPRVARASEPVKRPLTDALVITTRPGGCMDRASLSAAVAERMPNRKVDADFWVWIIENGRHVSLATVRDGEPGGPDDYPFSEDQPCEERRRHIAEGLVMVIDLMPPRRVKKPCGEPGTDEPAPKKTRPAPRRFPMFTIPVQGLGLFGPFDTIAPGIAAGIDVDVTAHFSVRGSAFTTGRVSVPFAGHEVEAALSAGRIDWCGGGHFWNSRLSLRGCIGMSAGSVEARGIGFIEPKRGVGLWGGVMTRGEARFWFWPSAGLVVSGDGMFAVNAGFQDLLKNEQARAYRPSRWGASVGIGTVVRFW